MLLMDVHWIITGTEILLDIQEICKDVVNHLTEVSGYVGGFVLLPCYCTQLLTNPKMLRWSFTHESNIIYPTDQTNRYTGRIQLVTAPGNFSLLICGLTKEDWGEYRCKISSDHVIQVKLKVTEGQNPTSVGTDNSCPTVSAKATTTVTKSISPTTSTSPTTSSSPTTSQHGYNSSSPSTTTKGHTVPLYTPYVAGVGGVLVLMGLGGVIYWRYRVQRRGQTVSREGQTGQRRDQQTQDDVMYSTVTHINTTRPTPRATDEVNNTEYVTIKIK
ncbi:uncharacterized protein LOC143522688 isoform X2 [Brachyhypopomus gauderio]|uniref:uncharacterized protein LOC143522688 isoform X2 n=1 Tax=Brachyhypopomus gauderio TaxID=698409 RepID=UPI004041BAF8